jgi:acyl-CoA synthetase (AMP-forming)/AMP-acid ligase II
LHSTLTYGQLSTASDNAAGRLHAMGCQPGHRIAVLLPRSLELIIAVMGILKWCVFVCFYRLESFFVCFVLSLHAYQAQLHV